MADVIKVETAGHDARTLQAADEVLSGQSKKGKLARLLPFLGPAFIASVAYMDPGNFATNIAGGAQFGYMLLWVIVASNLMAMLLQTLSAKLGIATGRNLAEVCRDRFPRPDCRQQMPRKRAARDAADQRVRQHHQRQHAFRQRT